MANGARSRRRDDSGCRLEQQLDGVARQILDYAESYPFAEAEL